MRLMNPWNNVKRIPEMTEHPDIPGMYLNYYVNHMGLLVPLWPADGPMSVMWEED